MSRNSAPEWDVLSGSSLSGNCVPESMLRMGRTFPGCLQTETASRNARPERDALSETTLKRKLHPGIRLQNGMPFPVEPLAENSSRNRCSGWDALSAMEPQAETMSQNSVSEWDAVSAERFNRKVCPVLGLDSGTRLPPGMPSGNCVPVWWAGGHKLSSPYRSTSLSHVGRMVWRMPAVCSFFASVPAERTSFMVKRMSGWP